MFADKDRTKNDTTTDTDKDKDDDFHPDELRELDPTVDPDEEVTPKNEQVPIDDEAKQHQDDVNLADHVRKGFPSNGVPRTDEERKKMKQAGLIQ